MKNAKMITAPAVGEYLYIAFPHGYVQVKNEAEGVVVDIWDANDEHISTCIASNKNLRGNENE